MSSIGSGLVALATVGCALAAVGMVLFISGPGNRMFQPIVICEDTGVPGRVERCYERERARQAASQAEARRVGDQGLAIVLPLALVAIGCASVALLPRGLQRKVAPGIRRWCPTLAALAAGGATLTVLIVAQPLGEVALCAIAPLLLALVVAIAVCATGLAPWRRPVDA